MCIFEIQYISIQDTETGYYIPSIGLKIVGLKVCLNVKIDVKTTQGKITHFNDTILF